MLTFRASVDIMAMMENLTQDQIMASMQQWQGWIGGLAAAGHFVSTEQLAPEGMVLTGPNAAATDGPFMEVKEMLGGFLILTANDIKEAAELSKGCPVLAEGGSVEIRPLMVLEF